MKTAEEICGEFGIRPPRFADGRYYTTCPKCSASRSRAHQKSECLGITINAKGVHFGCSHCGWKGGGYYNGSGGERTNALNCYYSYGARLRKVRGPNKRFWWEHLDGGGRWTKGTGGQNTKILYRLDEVRRAIADDREIVVVEGEKDVDNLWAIGIPATCNAHGAHDPTKKQKPKWYREHSEQLRGAQIVVFNDNDQAGYEHAEATCKLSHGVAKRVRRLDLKEHWPEIPNGGDVSDWLAARGTREQLHALVEQAQDWQPRHEPTTDPDIADAGAIDGAFREFNASISAAKSKDDKLTAIRRCAKAIAPYGDNDDRLVVRLYEAIPDDVDIEDADKEIHIGFGIDPDDIIEPNGHAGTAEKRKPQRKTKPRTNGHGDTGDAGGTREQLDALVEKAPDWTSHQKEAASDPDASLAELNEIHATVSVAGKFRVMTYVPHPLYPLQRVVMFSSKTDFCSHVVEPRIPVTVKIKGETRTTLKSRGLWWIEHADHRRFDDIDFVPGAGAVIEVPDPALPRRIIRKANMFSGFSVLPAKGDCRLFLAHVRDHLCQGQATVYDYVINWMASGVQNPGNPARAALSLRGVPGSGKGIFATGYGMIFGRHFLHLAQREHVVGKFNAHSAEACLTFADESLFVGDARDADIIKTLISEQTKMLERKGIDAVPVRSYGRLIFGTNHDHPLRLEVHDRRTAALHALIPPDMVGVEGADKRKAYFLPILRQMNNGGRAALLDMLLQIDTSKFNPEAIPQTEELTRQKLLSAPPADQAIIAIAQDACLPGALISRPWIARAHRDNDRAGLLDVIKRRGGKALERASDNALSAILKDWGFTKKALAEGTGWVAPSLPELRDKICLKYPAVEWDDSVTEWGKPAAEAE